MTQSLIYENSNTFIINELGDGFRTLALPHMLFKDVLVITALHAIKTFYVNRNSKAITIHGIEKELNNEQIEYIIIDCKLPRIKSKAFKSLLRLCRMKQIIFIKPPSDTESIGCAMQLLTVTKNPNLKITKFND